MTRFTLGVLAALSTSMLFVGAPIRADEPTHASAPAAVSDGRQLLTDIGTAYENLNAFACHYSVKAGSGEQLMSGSIALRKPDAYAIFASTTGSPEDSIHWVAVTNGKTYFVVDPHDAKHYYKMPKPAFINDVWRDVGYGGSTTVSLLLQRGSHIDKWYDGASDASFVISNGEPIDGVATKTLTFTTEETMGAVHYSRNIRLTIGDVDHLLRHAESDLVIWDPSSKQPEIHGSRTEEFTDIKTGADVTDALFVFTPPPGLTLGDAKARQARLARRLASVDTKLKVGAKPMAFAAKDLKKAPVSLASYKGKVVLLDFWATWCGPCRGEMPNVKSVYSKYHAKGFDIVGISLDRERAALDAYLSTEKIPWRQVLDNGIADKYNVQVIPSTVLIGKDGKIAAVNVRGEELGQAVARALAAK